MSRILVLGSSFSACMRTAWSEGISDETDHDITFFAGPRKTIAKAVLSSDHEFGPPADDARAHDILHKINGCSTISLKGFDVIALVGLEASSTGIVSIVRSSDVEGLRKTGAPTLLSSALFDRLCDVLVELRRPDPLWQNWTDRRLVVLAKPYPSEAVLTLTRDDHGDGQGYKPQFQIIRQMRPVYRRPQGLLEAKKRMTNHIIADYAAHGIDFLPQSPETETDTGLTRLEYSKGALGFEKDHTFPVVDVTHMNTDYGAICVRQLLAYVDATASAMPRKAQAY